MVSSFKPVSTFAVVIPEGLPLESSSPAALQPVVRCNLPASLDQRASKDCICLTIHNSRG